MRGLSQYMALAALAVLVAGCVNHDTVDGEVDMVLTDVVTYEGPVGQDSMRFSLRQRDDSPLVMLSCTGVFRDTTVVKGMRMLLSYVPDCGKPYVSGPVSLRGAYKINYGNAEEGNITRYPAWDRDKVYLYAMWRTGEFLNLHCRLVYSEKPRTLKLLLDSATLGDAVPQAYLVHQLDTPLIYHDRTNYMSWNLSRVWDRDDVKGINVHISNSNMPQTQYLFMK